MNGTEQKKALEHIKLMLGARVHSGSAIGPDTVKAYLIAVSDHPLESVEAACIAFIKGNVLDYDFDYYPPSAPRLSIEVGKWAEAQKLLAESRAGSQRMVVYKVGTLPPPPLKPLGPIRMEIEGIMRDTSSWSYEEKEYALREGKMPESRRLGALGKPVTARLQKMSDR